MRLCTDKVKQSLDEPLNPPPVSPSGPSAPIQDDGLLKQTYDPNKERVTNLSNSNGRSLK
ncbi:hypothetical protein [Candidatus Nitrosocosmicus sp. R]